MRAYRQQWSAFAELGLTALPVPDAQGGFGGGPVDMLVAMQELGRALVVEPYWATAVAVEALRVAGSGSGDDAALLEAVAQGHKRLAVAFHEPHARYDLYELGTHAHEQGGACRLSGTKSVVQHGAQAHAWIVPARVDGGGIGLFVVERDAAGVTLTDYRTIDGQRAATIAFDNTPARQLAGGVRDAAALEQIADYATFLLCAEAVGALDELNRATSNIRRRANSSACRSRVPGAAAPDGRHADTRGAGAFADLPRRGPICGRRCRCAAQGRVGGEGARAAARFVGQQAVQLHGGMGVTNEVAAAHLFKRLSIIETTLGDTDHHLARIAALPDFAQADAA
jgi:alkylation response protein AidB-like acyl-CoA dehydrogenase